MEFQSAPMFHLLVNLCVCKHSTIILKPTTKEKNPLRLHVAMTKRQKSLKVQNILSENNDEL